MPKKAVDVVISGGGPNGLMLASELALAGVRPVVLERLSEPSEEPRANGLVGQVVRLLDMRGMYHEFGGPAGPPRPAPFFFFAGMPVSFEAMETNPLYAMLLPQPKLVRLMAKRVHGLGAEIRWGHELTGLDRRDGLIQATVAGPDGPYQIETRFLVGADGGKSVVRKQAGIAFPGTTSETVTRLGHACVPDELRAEDGGLDVPGFGHLRPGFNRLERGTVVFAELEPGRPLVAAGEAREAPVPEDVPVTFQELRDSLRRVLGVDLPITPPTGPGPHALRRIDGQNTRQAEVFRKGNVFLVGDAAHVHSSMGGPGLNLGLQDAVNLGWKLAGEVNGWAPAGLLDTYQAERYPVGERVIMHSLAQSALMMPGAEVTALRQLLDELLALPANSAYIANLLAGSDTRYEVDDTHALSGRMVPDFEVQTTHGPQRTDDLLHAARPVLLDCTPDATFVDAAQGWSDRVDLVTAVASAAPAKALLIRPDGYVAWATSSPEQTSTPELHQALTHWFGPALSN